MNIGLSRKLATILLAVIWIPLVFVGIFLGIAMTPFYIGHRFARYAASLFQVSVLDKLKT